MIGAQGLGGAVKAKIFTALPDALTRYGALTDKTGKRYEITAFRAGKPGEAVMSFQGITSRQAAEALKGTQLFIAREALPPTGHDEFYHADLIGLPAVSDDGTALGICVAVDNFGAGDVLEVRRPDGKSFMVPMRAEAVPDWDGERLVIAAVWAQD